MVYVKSILPIRWNEFRILRNKYRWWICRRHSRKSNRNKLNDLFLYDAASHQTRYVLRQIEMVNGQFKDYFLDSYWLIQSVFWFSTCDALQFCWLFWEPYLQLLHCCVAVQKSSWGAKNDISTNIWHENHWRKNYEFLRWYHLDPYWTKKITSLSRGRAISRHQCHRFRMGWFRLNGNVFFFTWKTLFTKERQFSHVLIARTGNILKRQKIFALLSWWVIFYAVNQNNTPICQV